MRKYISFFRMKFIAGLQYRTAALAGIVTQFVWGLMELLLFKAFYEADPAAFPMSFQALSSYIWMQQAFISIFITWFIEADILQSISDGNIAYELCRPIELYQMWFVRSMAFRLSRAVLRCFPILIIASFLPSPYGLSLPVSLTASLWFLITMLLGFLIAVSLVMLIYIISFYTISTTGLRVVVNGLVEFLSGNILPMPFFPDNIKKIVELLPFASMQNVPMRIYSGDIAGIEIYKRLVLQAFWLAVLVYIGSSLTARALKRIVVQGG